MEKNYASKLRKKLDSEESKAFRYRFKEKRKAKKKDQKDVAKDLHVSVDTVRNWEQGFSMPGIDTLISICNYFDCSLDTMLGKIDEKNHDVHFICEKTGLHEKVVESLIDTKKTYQFLQGLIDSDAYKDHRYPELFLYAMKDDVEQSLIYRTVANYILLDHELSESIFNYIANSDYIKHASVTWDKRIVNVLISYCSKKDQADLFPEFNDFDSWATEAEQNVVEEYCQKHGLDIDTVNEEFLMRYINQALVSDGGDLTINEMNISSDMLKQVLIRRIQDGLDRVKMYNKSLYVKE